MVQNKEPADEKDLVPLPESMRYSRLAELEGVISSSLEQWLKCGFALLEINQNKLYTTTHKTFEEYCLERWGLRRTNAWHYMTAASAKQKLDAANVQNLDKITNRDQYLELAKLEDDQIPIVAARVIETSTQTGVKITGRLIRETAGILLQQPSFDNPIQIDDEQHQHKPESPTSDSKPEKPKFPCPVCNRTGYIMGRPICPQCSKRTGQAVFMKAGSSPANISYYYCPTAGCKQQTKVPRNMMQQKPANTETR